MPSSSADMPLEAGAAQVASAVDASSPRDLGAGTGPAAAVCSTQRAGLGGRADVDSLRRVTRVAVLAAVALALSYVETTIPLPLVFPGAKLGLANIAVLVALFAYGPRTAVSVAVVKVLAAGFIFGSPLMMAYSLGGTALALAGMLLLALVPGISVTLVSMVSAVLHNTGQVLVACAMLGTTSVLLSLPVLAAVALVTGALTGVVASAVLAQVEEGGLSVVEEEGLLSGIGTSVLSEPAAIDPTAFGAYHPGNTLAHRLDPRVKIAFVVLFFIAAFVASDAAGLVAVALVAVVAMACSGAGVSQALRWLRPFWGLFLFVAVFDLLFTRDGDVLWAAGVVSITTGGIAFAAESVVRFACMALGTSSLMATTSPAELTQGVGGLLAPFSRLGLRTENVVLALSLTLQFLPVVAGEFAAAKAARDAEEAARGRGDADADEATRDEDYASRGVTRNEADAGHQGAGSKEAGHGKGDLRGFARGMKSFGLAFAPAFASALRRADNLAVELAQNPELRAQSVAANSRSLTSSDFAVLAVSAILALLVVLI